MDGCGGNRGCNTSQATVCDLCRLFCRVRGASGGPLGSTVVTAALLWTVNPDRDYLLDLSVPDEREMARILVTLAVSEPGMTRQTLASWKLDGPWHLHMLLRLPVLRV